MPKQPPVDRIIVPPFGRARDLGAGGPVPVDILGRARQRIRKADARTQQIDPATGQRIAPTRVASIAPWYEFPIPSSQFIFKNASSLALAAGAGQIVAGPSFQLPSGSVGVIRSVNIFIDSPTLLTNIKFALLINNAPVNGLDALREFPRVANNVSKEFERAVLVPNGALISTLITNLDAAGPWVVGMEFSGWAATEADIESYTGLPAMGG